MCIETESVFLICFAYYTWASILAHQCHYENYSTAMSSILSQKILFHDVATKKYHFLSHLLSVIGVLGFRYIWWIVYIYVYIYIYIIDRIWWRNHPRHITTNNTKTVGKVATSDLMSKWVTNKSPQSSKMVSDSLTHRVPYITKIKKVTQQTTYILDTLSSGYTQQTF